MASGGDWLTACRLAESYTTLIGVGEEIPLSTIFGAAV